jgi:hypothetical protein
MAGRRRLLLQVPNCETDPITFVYRKAPVDEEFAERLLAAAASVPSRRFPKGTGYVYVALLEPERPRTPYRLYVGSTGLGPLRRYCDHKRGYKSGRGQVEKHGLGLLPKVYARFNPMRSRDKEDVEHELGDALKRAGFEVHGPHRKTGRGS